MATKVASRQVKARVKRVDPVTPGELLEEEFLIPMGISKYRLAKEINVPAQH